MTSVIYLSVCFILTCQLPLSKAEENLSITILHTNDVHSRFAQTNKHSGACSVHEEEDNKCFGGFARLHYKVNEIRSTHKNVLYLSGGDYYQGTVWYTIHKWRIVSEMVNVLNHTALALGNHEFDDNIAGLLPFVDSATFPIVDANIDASEEPDILARQKNGKITKSVVVTADNGAKIGIIGYTTQDTPSISNPGRLKFLDVVKSIDEEANRLYNEEGVKILIALGHGGFDVDQEVAAAVPLIDAVVGGHTNTFLYTGTPPNIEMPLGEYPFIVTQASGRKVPCVQAYAFGKYLGYLNLTFDKNGEVIKALGNPILLDGSVPQDEKVLQRVNEWGKNVTALTKMEVGRTRVFLNGKSEQCRLRECNLGNLITDAMVFMMLKFADDKHWSDTTMAIMNSGGIRGSIDELAKSGSISMEDVLQVLPFQNTVDFIEIKGEHLLESFEYAVEGYDPKRYRLPGKFLQVSGIQVVYDITKPDGKRVKSLKVLCKACREPYYEPLNLTQVYKVAVPTYIATGGDGFVILRDNKVSHHISGFLDSDMLVEYLKYKSPIIQPIDGRIRFVDPTENPRDCDNGNGRSNGNIVFPLHIVFLLLSVLLPLEFF